MNQGMIHQFLFYEVDYTESIRFGRIIKYRIGLISFRRGVLTMAAALRVTKLISATVLETFSLNYGLNMSFIPFSTLYENLYSFPGITSNSF